MRGKTVWVNEMTTQYVGNSFSRCAVELDDTDFTDCKFDDCELVYRGGRPPTMDSCSFTNTRFKFEGAAANTVAFLKAMASPKSGLQLIIRETFPELRGH